MIIVNNIFKKAIICLMYITFLALMSSCGTKAGSNDYKIGDFYRRGDEIAVEFWITYERSVYPVDIRETVPDFEEVIDYYLSEDMSDCLADLRELAEKETALISEYDLNGMIDVYNEAIKNLETLVLFDSWYQETYQDKLGDVSINSVGYTHREMEIAKLLNDQIIFCSSYVSQVEGLKEQLKSFDYDSANPESIVDILN